MPARFLWLNRLAGLMLGAVLVAVVAPWSTSAVSVGAIAASTTDTDTDTDTDADEEREIRRQQARQAFVENCLMCHGEDMTTRQRLTTKQWTTEVEKMVSWGAPLPLDRKQPLIDHLAETYPNTQPSPSPERITPDRALELDRQPAPKPLPNADLARGEALFVANCAVCHAANAKGGEIGVNLVSKPVLLREAEFRSLMKEGRRRMPSFQSVLDDAKQDDLLAWLRKQL